MNISPHQYIVRQRLKRAMHLLVRGESCIQTAKMSGFSNYSHLDKAFRKHLGITPKVYQNHNK